MNDPLIQGGYVIIARRIKKSKLWLSLKTAHRMVMMEILLQAQWQDGEVVRNGEILFLKRGQVATSYQQLVDDIADKDITVKIVRTAIDKMERAQFLAKDEAVQKAKKGLLLTVVKYDFFQDPDNYKGRVKGNDDGRARAEQGQSEGRARAINNNIKNLEKEKELIIPLSHSDSKMNCLAEMNRFNIKQKGVRRLEEVESFQNLMDDDLILDAIKRAEGKGIEYLISILDEWNDLGYRQLLDHPDVKKREEAKQRREAAEREKKQLGVNQGSASGNSVSQTPTNPFAYLDKSGRKKTRREHFAEQAAKRAAAGEA